MKQKQESLMELDERSADTGHYVGFRFRKSSLILAAVGIVIIGLLVSIISIQKNQITLKELELSEKEAQIEELENRPSVMDSVAPSIDLDAINAEIHDIGELATTEYVYTNAAKFSDTKEVKGVKGVKLPFTQKSFILKWDGVIKAGVDIEEIRTSLDGSEKILTVSLPPAKILSHETIEDSVEVLDEKNGLFNSITVGDKVQFDAEMAEEMEARALNSGLLEKAQANAEVVISRLLYANPDIAENYRIEFETLPQA